MINCWTKEWPKEPGRYWFCGRWCSSSDKTDIYSVRVVLDSKKNPTYIADGNFLYKSEGGDGFWIKAEIPALPNHLDEVINK